MLQRGARVVAIDQSSAVDVTASKARALPNWFGIQADIGKLSFCAKSSDVVYCEGVIQHTQNSEETVKELVRVTKPAGLIAATHYNLPHSLGGRCKLAISRFIK